MRFLLSGKMNLAEAAVAKAKKTKRIYIRPLTSILNLSQSQFEI